MAGPIDAEIERVNGVNYALPRLGKIPIYNFPLSPTADAVAPAIQISGIWLQVNPIHSTFDVDVQALQQDLNTLRAQNASLRTSSDRQLTQANQELYTLRSTLAAKDQQFAAKVAQLTEEVNRLKNQVALSDSLQESNRVLKDTIEKIRQENSELQKRIILAEAARTLAENKLRTSTSYATLRLSNVNGNQSPAPAQYKSTTTNPAPSPSQSPSPQNNPSNLLQGPTPPSPSQPAWKNTSVSPVGGVDNKLHPDQAANAPYGTRISAAYQPVMTRSSTAKLVSQSPVQNLTTPTNLNVGQPEKLEVRQASQGAEVRAASPADATAKTAPQEPLKDGMVDPNLVRPSEEVEYDRSFLEERGEGFGEIAYAHFDFDAEDYRETSCIKGDKIEIVKKMSREWWVGRVVRTGRFGMIPSDFLGPAPP